MTNKIISHEAEIWLNEELEKYKSDIISRVPFTNGDREITVQDLIQAKYALDNYNSIYNMVIKNMIKQQRKFLYIATLCIIVFLISILYFIVGYSNTSKDIEFLTFIMTVASFIIAFMSVIIIYSIKNKQRQIPDKKKLVDIYMNKWNDFEWNLKQQYFKEENKQASSLLSVMQLYLGTFDENYPQKAKDFYYTLNMRNRIIHGELSAINNEELNYAIKIIDKLSSELKFKQKI